MRYRRLDDTGDMTFGRGQGNLWINQPEGVAQWVMSRLRLNYGEWFADLTDGTPWAAQVLGERTQATRDAVVRSRVFQTGGVVSVTGYNSILDPNTREWGAAMTVLTSFGPAALAVARLPGALPPGAVVPPSAIPAGRTLGLRGTGGTGISMVPAPLDQGAAAAITDFQFRSLDPGTY
jgi:hypothetical protein